jgi:flagellar biosynthesis GTPase FlhF
MKHFNVITISLIIGSLIGSSVLILSYLHTAGLFERSGYAGGFAHIGVIGFELVFILGTGISIWSKWQGEKVATSTKFALGLGVCINLYSNITSGIAKYGKPLTFFYAKGIPIDEAVLIGALIPILFVVAEMVISDAISKTRMKTPVQEPEEAADQDTEPLDEPAPTTPEPVQPIPLEEPAYTPPTEPAVESNETPEEKPAIEPAQKEEQEKPSTVRKPRNTKGKSKKSKSKERKQTPASEVDYEAIMEVAKQLKTERSKVGRDLLAKAAGTTPHHARIALAKLEDADKVS